MRDFLDVGFFWIRDFSDVGFSGRATFWTWGNTVSQPSASHCIHIAVNVISTSDTVTHISVYTHTSTEMQPLTPPPEVAGGDLRPANFVHVGDDR